FCEILPGRGTDCWPVCLHSANTTVEPIWKRWKPACEPRFIKPGPRLSRNCCGTQRPLPTSTNCRVPAAHTRNIRDHVPNRYSPWLVGRGYPNDEVGQKAWIKVHQKRLLDKGKIEKLVVAIRSIHSTNPEVADKIRIEAEYFETNAERM